MNGTYQTYTLMDLTIKLDKSLPEIIQMKNKGEIKLVGSIAGVAYYEIQGEIK